MTSSGSARWRSHGARSRSHDSAGSLVGHGDLVSSLVLIFPLLLIYEIGVLFAGRVNGVDLVTRLVFSAAGSPTAYLVIYAIIAIGFLLWIRAGRRWGSLRLDTAGPMILEAALYALTLGAVVSLILDRLFGPLFGHLLGLGLTAHSAISAVGAGVHEELVFRLALIAGLVALARRLGPLDRRIAIGFAFIASSLVFAAAHHLGAHGEPWNIHAFAFRALAGLAFAAIFWFRSLAHAVYAHVLYDLLVAAT